MATLRTDYDSVTNSNALTITLASLATSSTLLAGNRSDIVSNVTNQFVDMILSGRITAGTSPTAGVLQVLVYGQTRIVAGVSSYPVATATELTETAGSSTFEAEQKQNLRVAHVTSINATTDRPYSIPPISIASLFGGVLPMKWGVWVTHNTVAALNATAGNHFLHWTGIKYVSA